MSRAQIIRDEAGNPAFVVMPWVEYRALAPDSAEAIMSDEDLYDAAVAAGEEYFPIEVTDRLLAREAPVKVFREYRGLTQKALAEAASIAPLYLSQIETGKRGGSLKTLSRLARALSVDLDSLVAG